MTVSLLATLLASVIMIPLGLFLYVRQARILKITYRLAYLFMGIPSVIVGLLFVILFSGAGPFGFLNLIYTVPLMVLAQAALVSPIILGLSLNLLRRNGKEPSNLAKTLGANGLQTMVLLFRELFSDYAAVLLNAFSRALAEVGTVMIVGGNIRHHTRVMTTAISMQNAMGNFAQAFALGILLFIITLGVNLIVQILEGGNTWKSE